MANEIERKYRVDPKLWTPQGMGKTYHQGYLNIDPDRTVRVRIQGREARLTIKGRTTGITRAEFEYPIPTDDAAALLQLCEQPHIEKWRYTEEHYGRTWEIDVFSGANQGLVIAEVELKSETDAVRAPVWCVEEVSGDPRYYNSNLIKAPYKTWPKP